MTWDILKASKLLRSCLIQKKACLDIPRSVHISYPAGKKKSWCFLVRWWGGCRSLPALKPVRMLDLIESLAEPSSRMMWELFTRVYLSLRDQASKQLKVATTCIQPPNTLSSFSLQSIFPSVSFLPGATHSHCHHHYYYWPPVHLSRNTFREQFPSCAQIFEGFWSGQTPAKLNWAHAGPLSLSGFFLSLSSTEKFE